MAYGVFQERQHLDRISGNVTGTEKYFPARIDGAGSPKYYGFLAKGGAWYIMKETDNAGVDEYTYYTGNETAQTFLAFSTAWTGRASLTFVEACNLSLY